MDTINIETGYQARKKRAIKRLQSQFPLEWELTGGLSAPSKMPGFGTSTPNSFCKNGQKLAKVEGSVCFGCYAERGNYAYETVQRALKRRLWAISDPMWVPSMVTLIKAGCEAIGENFFRFHDSGDIYDMEHLEKIVQIAEMLPEIHFWIPTKEYAVVNKFRKERPFPKNLAVRVSAAMINQPAPKGFELSSTVTDKNGQIGQNSVQCEAYTRKNECGDCRACWDSTIKVVNYKKH